MPWNGGTPEQPFPSLGPQIVEHIEEFLCHGPGDVVGEPIELDDEFYAFIVKAYRLDPETGRRMYRRAFLSRAKGRAKSEIAGMLVCAEALFPVRFDGWDANGEPVGRPVKSPFIRCLATEEGQSGNTYDNVSTMLEYLVENHGDDFPGIDIGKSAQSSSRIILHHQRGEITPSTASSAAKDGGKETFAVFDEPMALDTPIPTPDGWKQIGDLKTGDYVYGVDGRPILVWGVAPIKRDRPCFRVTFDDGASVVTDATHRWHVFDRKSTKKWAEWTTQQMADANWYGGKRFAVAQAAALEADETTLPLDPYVLGLWLGDGDERAATLAVGRDDLDGMLAELHRVGFTTSVYDYSEDRGAVAVRFNHGQRYGKSGTSQGALRALGVLENKHAPDSYLWASREQRLALLQGLMDSDGYVNERGNCIFTSSSRALADAVVQLVRSLGWRTSAGHWSSDERWKSRVTGTWRVSFTPSGMVPFRMKRKAERCRPVVAEKTRAITSIEPVESVPVRCIAVDSEDHLFLAGESMLPTHNTHLYVLPELRRMHGTVRRNLRKRKEAEPWCLETSTMYEPGQDSVAEATHTYYKAIKEGRVRDADAAGLLFDHRQAKDGTDLADRDALLAGLREAYGPAAAWMDLDGIVAEIWDPQSAPSDSRRYWLNQPVAAEDALLDPAEWAKCASELRLEDGDDIVLGFDGGKSDDATALVAMRVSDRLVQPLGIWERPDGPLAKGWEVDRKQVSDLVAHAFGRYGVRAFFADVKLWESYIDEWTDTYRDELLAKASAKSLIGYDMRGHQQELTKATEALVQAIADGKLPHTNHPILNRHVGNARRRPNRFGVSFGKESRESPKKVDGFAAMQLADMARRALLASSEWTKRQKKRQRTGRVHGFG